MSQTSRLSASCTSWTADLYVKEVAATSTTQVGSFESFFRWQYPAMVRSLTFVCGNGEVAKDCVQEAFLRAHVHWSKVSGYDDPASWVRRVAINLARDHQRREGRRFTAKQRLHQQTAATVEHEDPGDLAGLLTRLPEQQRVALALFYGEELSVAEVARTMGLSDGAVKYHLHQGRERLRTLLA